MSLHRWRELPEERLTDLLSRRFFHAENVTLALFSLKRGSRVPNHKHEHEQLSYVIKGVLKCYIQGREVIIREGEVIQIPPFLEHGFEALQDTEDLDIFSPVRSDWASGEDQYLRAQA